jgi:hypothetical protein
VKVYAPLACSVSLPVGRPVSGSLSVTVVPGVSTWVLPSTLKPVTVAVLPAGMLALLSTLPLRDWPMGVAGVSGLSEYTALAGVLAARRAPQQARQQA